MQQAFPPAFIFVSPASFTSIREVQTLLPDEPDAITMHPTSVEETLKCFNKVGRAVIIVSASDLKHLKIAGNIATALKGEVRSHLAKIMVVTTLNRPDLPKFLRQHGCEDRVDAETNPKGLKLKLDRLSTKVEAAWEKLGLTQADLAASSPAAAPSEAAPAETGAPSEEPDLQAGEPSEAPASGKKPVVKAVAPLKVSDDCWILRGKAFKRVKGLWVIQAAGPSPEVGRWTRISGERNAWTFVLREPTENAFVTEGVWTYYGREPENKDKSWLFTGDQPRLTYSRFGKDVCHRFKCNQNNELLVAKNSRAALAKSDLIDSSYDGTTNFNVGKPDLGGHEHEEKHRKPLTPLSMLTIGPPAPKFSSGKFGAKDVADSNRLSFYEEILQELGPQPEMFFVRSNPKACQALLREAAFVHARSTLWTRGQIFRIDTEVDHFNEKTGAVGILFPSDMDWSGFQSSLRAVEAKEIFVNTNLGRTAIFFRQDAESLSDGGNSVEIKCPERIHEVQRRKDLRHHLRPEEDVHVRVTLENAPPSDWKMANIGANGVCVVRESAAPDDPASWLQRGSEIPSISFKVYGQEIECEAKVAWIQRTNVDSKHGEIRMGLQFDKITQADIEGIRLYVMEENHDYLRKKMARIPS